jgi:serine/threonine protein kinase
MCPYTQVAFALWLTQALAECAAADIQFGIISPASVMRMSDGSWRLSAFAAADPYTVFAAPELLRAHAEAQQCSGHAQERPIITLSKNVTPAADVWSVAVTLLRVWLTTQPCTGMSSAELHRHYASGWNPVEACLAQSSMTPDIKALLARCLALQPERRISATELSGQMRRIMLQSEPRLAQEALQRIDAAMQVRTSALCCRVRRHR